MSEALCHSGECRNTENPKVRIRRLGMKYGEKYAFQNVDLDVPYCSVTSVIGPSGSGKSSFLNCLNRMTDLIDNCSVEGSIQISEQEIVNQPIDTRSLRKRVGMIFQKPNPFPVTICRNLDLPLKYHGIKGKSERYAIIEKALKTVGLWEEVKDRVDESALKLSGGQQQRLCIARAIVLKPEILLFDEPCSSLDPISARVIEELILELRKSYTVMIVTHNMGQARRISDQTALFWYQPGGSTIIEAGQTKQIFENPKNPISADYIEGRLG